MKISFALVAKLGHSSNFFSFKASPKTIHLLQLIQWDTKVIPGQPSDVVPPAYPGSPFSDTCPKHLPRETSRRLMKQMPEPPQLDPLNVEWQCPATLWRELLSIACICDLVLFGEAMNVNGPENSELCVSAQLLPPSYYNRITAESSTNSLVDFTLHLSLTGKQDPKMLQVLHRWQLLDTSRSSVPQPGQ